MNIFIDTTRMEKLRKILIIMDVILILIVLISYFRSGFKLGGLLGYISSQDIGGDDARPYDSIFLLFVGLLLLFVVSLQLWVVQAMIKMINYAYQYPHLGKKEENREE